MRASELREFLERPPSDAPWLRAWGIENIHRAIGNLQSLAEAGITLELLAELCRQLSEHLPRLSDADRALNNMERFVTAARSPLALAALFEREQESLPILLQIFSTSQFLSDHLVRDPESYDLVRLTEGRPVARETLVQEIASEVAALLDDRDVLTALRRYKYRETLRIAYGDIVRSHSLEIVTRQLSFLADALCEAALQVAWRKLVSQRGVPRRPDGEPARFVVLALGKLGGLELNYSSDIDLVMLYDSAGNTDGERKLSNHEFFDRLARELVKLLATPTDWGQAYRVDLRLRPEGAHGPMAMATDAALQYYDNLGRTWERQAFVKARPAAGNLELGHDFLAKMQPWIYRRYLSRADITGIKALKRRIEHRATEGGENNRNVKTGHGGIRDIEFVIQFLQLLNGGDLPSLRSGNTLAAIAELERSGCLTMQERTLLSANYALLRRIEHRLQIMFDLQTHTLPEKEPEIGKLAVRLAYAGTRSEAGAAFQADYLHRTAENRKILDHLLHDAFRDEDTIQPEVDLVLAPDPLPEEVQSVLGRYRFRDVTAAYQNLSELAAEHIPFLSTRRCRHFLAAIAPRLLSAIAATPDPDSTLVNLALVSESLGGKAVLWELLSFNPPSLNLYVRLCAACPYLSGILVSHPGMIDELMDSLVLNRLPSPESLEASLAQLVRGAKEIEPILHSFKNAQHLRVGVRDVIGKENITDTHRALADIAEVCLRQIARHAYQHVADRYGEPTISEGPRAGIPSEPVILALGKLGGREPNYHSDLDLVFLYDADGETRHRHPRAEGTTCQHFFSEWGQRIIKTLTQLGPFGRLYDVDPRLRPTGKSGALAISLDELARYFAANEGQLWERQALCKARPVFGSPQACLRAKHVIEQILVGQPWQPQHATEIRDMRLRLQASASPQNLKRGPGGAMDIEFAVQMLQLKHAAQHRQILATGTLDALTLLHDHGLLGLREYRHFVRAYRMLRGVESGLRLMNTTARHDLPQNDLELQKLAYLLKFEGPAELTAECDESRIENRRILNQLCDEAARE